MKSLPVRSKEVVTFHSFARKGYALFAALQKEVRIGVLSAATLTTATPCLAHALSHPATFDAAVCDSLIAGDASLKEALVSASRAPMAAQVAARQVISLTKEDLQSAGVTTVNDVLKLAVGIDVRQRGGFGLQTDISIDGGTFDQITLLVNGISINNPQTGHNGADFPLNLADIERIEILEGAASRLFGSQAFSG
ncbi:TonB-dependent receptor, partial [Alloprevotella tannerae]